MMLHDGFLVAQESVTQQARRSNDLQQSSLDLTRRDDQSEWPDPNNQLVMSSRRALWLDDRIKHVPKKMQNFNIFPTDKPKNTYEFSIAEHFIKPENVLNFFSVVLFSILCTSQSSFYLKILKLFIFGPGPTDRLSVNKEIFCKDLI